MLDTRLDALEDWLEAFFSDANFVISKASDDASFRRYFRIERDNASFIAMDAPPEKEDCQAFVDIAKLLIAHQVHAPKIVGENLAQGFLLLEDLGDTTLLAQLQQQPDLGLYQRAIDALIDLQAIKQAEVPSYDAKRLQDELSLLLDWYLPKTLDTQTSRALQQLFDVLIDNALKSPQVLVHRDYHSRNLMVLPEDELGVIDFQDAVIGADTYDLVSLLKDAYLELSHTDRGQLLEYYYQQAKVQTPWAQFERQFDLMGLQRHLKVLGIFKRLSVRDGKHQYLDDIPLVRRYALQTAEKYSECSILLEVL